MPINPFSTVKAGDIDNTLNVLIKEVSKQPMSDTIATLNQTLVWDGDEWVPTTVPSGGGITELTGDVNAGPGTGTQAATVTALQGTPVSAVVPSVDGQVLTWNGSEWVPGAPAAGGSGGGGQIYFLNNGTIGDAPLPALNTKEFGLVAEVPLTTVTSVTLPNDGVTYTLVAGFVTALNKPGLTSIPTGIWDFNIWANAGGPSLSPNVVKFRLKVYKWDGVLKTLLATSGIVPLFDPSQVVQYITSALVPQTVLTITDRIYVELEATSSNNNHTITVSFGDAAPSHVHTALPSIAGTGIVHVINGVVQSPASAVNLAGGSSEVTGTLPVGNGGTGVATTPSNGQLLIGNGTGYTQAALTAGDGVTVTSPTPGNITIASSRIAKYPALDANTILAWNFTGTTGSIANLGTAGAGADMVTVGSQVARNVPGPINSGVGLWGQSINNGVWTAQGAGASLGSLSFTNQITLLVFFQLTNAPGASSVERLLVKGANASAWSGSFVGAALEFTSGSLLGGVATSNVAAGNRNTTAVNGSGAWGWSQGMHMAAYTYDGTISRVFWDGTQIATTNHGSAANIVIGTAGNEGPWNIGTNYSGAVVQGGIGVFYHASVHNVVRSASWLRQAWVDANGWP